MQSGFSDFDSDVELVQWLLAPTPWASFADEFWNKKPLLLQRGDPSYYKALLSESDLEFALHLATRRRGAAELLSNGSPRPAFSAEGAVRAVRSGQSLRLNAIQRFSPRLGRLKAALEQKLSCPININMYLTPGDGRALDRHFDTHDVLVIQVNGQKQWKLFDEREEDPLESLPMVRGETRGQLKKFRLKRAPVNRGELDPTQEFTLQSGDLLYLPRGYSHEAQGALGTTSCHLTIGFQVFTYLDLLSVAISDAAHTLPSLRRALPTGFAYSPGAADEVRTQIATIMPELAPGLDTDAAMHALRRIFIGGRGGLSESGLLQPPSDPEQVTFRPEAAFAKRRGVIAGMERSGDELVLSWADTELAFPLRFEEACTFLLASERFTLDELPTSLSAEDKQSFTVNLLSAGLLIYARNGEVAIPDRGRVPERGREQRRFPSPKQWLPVEYDAEKRELRWQFFGKQPLNKPFFAQSVKQAARRQPLQRRSPFPVPLAGMEGVQASPAGLIFHISRCGSTLVSNAMQQLHDTVVVSEAGPVNQALTPAAALGGDEGVAPLREMMRIFCLRGEPGSRTIFKLTSWNTLHLELFRKAWPEAPVLVVVRHPLEVVASCLRQPPGWMRAARAGTSALPLDWLRDGDTMSEAALCSRLLGEFLTTAEKHLGESIQCIDYADLTLEGMLCIAERFGMETSAEERERIEQSMEVYSKDPRGETVFEEDSEEKQEELDETQRADVEHWAQPAYRRLLASPYLVSCASLGPQQK